MFTGIIQHVGTLRRVVPTAGGRRLTIELGPIAEGLRLGDSVAVCGACLTASDIRGSEGDFDVMAETLRATRLGQLTEGTKVNLERALRLGDGLDGHLVQGHVDCVATARSIDEAPGKWVGEFAVGPETAAQLVPKGSVAIDGVSLTVVDVGSDGFTISLIPTTLADTTLADLRPGDAVNVELDVIGKYVHKHLRAMLGGQPGNPARSADGGVSLETLRDAGFL
jgi:riboflavin synthase